MSLVTHKYSPGEMSDRELEATFAAREPTIDCLLKALRDQIHSGALSSFVITGPRGTGKSTVIYMTVLRIKQDPELMAGWMPVVFPEEQFDLASLRDLLAATLQQLAAQGKALAQTWLQKVEAEPNDEQSQQLAITGLREVTRRAGKRLILFIENLNFLLEESLDDQMKGALRRLLTAEPFMMIIGSAVHTFASLKSYDFGQVRLDRLTAEQAFELLTRRARFDNNERFLRDFPKQQAKVRAVVHLSGGNPRFILTLYELLSQRPVVTIAQYLRRLVDELTPLLEGEMENLPPQQRKIIHALMERGGTAQPAELVAPTRLPLNVLTTQLRRLKEAQIIEVLGGGKGRAANYTVPDKLFAIWYQMRYLSQNRRRIELFVEILRIWFEEEEKLLALQDLSGKAGTGAPSVPRESATDAGALAATFKSFQRGKLAAELCAMQWVKADLQEAVQVYADFSRAGNGTAPHNGVEPHAELGTRPAEPGGYQHAARAMDELISKCVQDPVSLAWALYNRGVYKGILGDTRGEIADYTAVVEMQDAPKERRAKALFNRGMSKGTQGDTLGAIADYSVVAEMQDAPKEQQAQALFNRGMTKGMLGDTLGTIADYTAVLEMQDAPKEQQARALINRGVTKATLGDTQGATADYTAVAEMQDAPKEQQAQALFNRGVTKGTLGDTQGEIADYTAVAEMQDAPKEQRAKALFNRGVSKETLGDTQGAIADYTAVVEMQDAPKEEQARALFNSATSKGRLGDIEGAIADFLRIVELGVAEDDLLSDAARLAFRISWVSRQQAEADEILDHFAVALKSLRKDKAREVTLHFLGGLVLPGFADAWVHACRVLAKALEAEVKEVLEFLEPICAVLEGKGHSVLNSLPPEQREFAESTLKRFETKA